MDITSYLLGKQSGGGSTINNQDKTISVTSNGTKTASADEGYTGLGTVTINTNVPTAADDYFTTTVTNSNRSNFKNVFLKQTPALMLDSNVTNLQGTFSEWSYPTINLSSFDTTNVTRMQGMFSISSLSELDVTNFNTSNVTNMQAMFSNMSNISTLNLTSFDTKNVTTMSNMFGYCMVLKTISGSFDLSSCTNINGMFNYCTSLEDLPTFSNIGKAYDVNSSEHNNNYKMLLSSCTNLTHTSLMNVINGLYDLVTAGIPTQDLVLGATNLAKLSQAEQDIATNKGWTLS